MANHLRAKDRRALMRARPTRSPAERILVVCEGEKTEPNYLKDLISDLGLTSARVIICGEECGSDPMSVVKFAANRSSKDGGFDHTYCVFDKDRHPTFNNACEFARTLREEKKKSFHAIASIPCFEYWILLHFENTSRPYDDSGKNSLCDNCVSDVQQYITDYQKSYSGLYSRLKPNLALAIERAKKRQELSILEGSDNPSTNFPMLVEKLLSMKPHA